MGDASAPHQFFLDGGDIAKMIAIDYITYRLNEENLIWVSDKHSVNRSDDRQMLKICSTMRTLANELEDRYRKTFDEMCNGLNITPSTAENILSAVTNELFNGDIQWGTIVALFAFGGCMAVQCHRKEMQAVINQIVDWIASYCDDKLRDWMMEHGSWDGFVEYFEVDNNKEWTNKIMWPSLKNFFYGVAAGAIGVLTLGAFLTSRP